MTKKQLTILHDRLLSLSDLKDGWDSYGASAPNPQSIQIAEKVLKELADSNYLPTEIVPSSMGGVAFVFDLDSAYVDIEFFNNGNIIAGGYSVGDVNDTILHFNAGFDRELFIEFYNRITGKSK